MKEFIEKVFDELFDMSSEEFMKNLEKHKNGDVARSLLDINCFDYLESDKTSFCYDQYGQLPLIHESHDFNKRTQIGSRIESWDYDDVPIEQETTHNSPQGSEPSKLEMDELNYTINCLPIKRRVYRKKNAPYMTEMSSTLTDVVNNSSDDYDYECAA